MLKLKVLISQEEDVNMETAQSELRLQGTACLSGLEVGRRTLATLILFDQLR